MAITDHIAAGQGPPAERAGGDGVSARARLAAFRKARRHTLHIRSMRLALPVLAIVAAGGYGVTLYATLKLRQSGIRLPQVEVTSEDLKMKNPSYFGVGKDGSRYDVRAREALVDLAQTGPIRLFDIDGDLTQTTGVVTRLKSKRGNLDNKRGELELFEGVEIDASNGLKARLRSATVFNKEDRIVSKEPVVADMPTGRIKGNAMVLHPKARTGTFQGNVQLHLATGADGTPRAALGTGRDARQPVDVTADRMDFNDNTRQVQFTRNVSARQGETELAAPNLLVVYEGRAEVPGLKAATPADARAEPEARLQRISASNGVLITAGADRRIRADTADFDVKADSALFTGQVVEVTQGKNRLVGRRLAVDRKSGRSRLDSPAAQGLSAGRIQTTFYQTQTEVKAKTAKAPGKAPGDGGDGGVMNFRTDPNAPIDIEADTLDVADPAKQAVFRGRVRAQQGDFLIQTAELVANYTGETGLMAAPEPAVQPQKGQAEPKGQGAQISRVEARNKVVVTNKDGQEAAGEWAIFDVKANTVLMGGGVTVKRARDTVTGSRLRIDTTTGEAKFENEPGAANWGPVVAPFGAPKSAAGPGGLPQITQAQPAPKAPAADAACPPGRQCLTAFPEEAKKAIKEKAAGKAPVARAGAEKDKSRPDGWQPSLSPSPVYRSQ